MDLDASTAKRAVLEKLLNESMVLVTVDARDARVDVPDKLRNDPQLRLNLSYRFRFPLEIDEWGVHATLTFDGQPYTCKLPWDRMYSFVSHSTGQPFIFPADVPAELANQLEPLLDDTYGKDRRPKLEVVHGEGGHNDNTAEVGDEPDPTPPEVRRSHLRVVK